MKTILLVSFSILTLRWGATADIISLFTFEGSSFLSSDGDASSETSALADMATGTAALSASATASGNRRFLAQDVDGDGPGSDTSIVINYSMNREAPASNDANTRWYEFTVTPTDSLKLTTFTADVAVNVNGVGGTTVADYFLYSSLDGFATAIDGGKTGPSLTANGQSAFQTLSWDLSSLPSLTGPTTFRFDPVATGGTNGTNAQRGGSFDNLALNGGIVPEPGSFMLLASGIGLLAACRRRG